MIGKRKRKCGRIKKMCAGWIRNLGICSNKIADGLLLRRRLFGTSMERGPN